MTLNPNNPKAVADEVTALVAHIGEGGHDTQSAAMLCALTMGCLIHTCADDDADRRRAFYALVNVIRHHAGIEPAN